MKVTDDIGKRTYTLVFSESPQQLCGLSGTDQLAVEREKGNLSEIQD